MLLSDMTPEQLTTFNTLKDLYNYDVAMRMIDAMNIIMPDTGNRDLLDCVAAALLVCKAVLGTYCELAYKDSEDAPLGVRSVGYYAEQCMATLAEHFQNKRDNEDKPSLILQ